LVPSDAPALYDYYRNPAVHRCLDWRGPASAEAAEGIIENWNRGFVEGWILRFAIADKASDEVIGTIFLGDFDMARADIGYELSETHWRKGIMGLAVDEVLRIGFGPLGLERIQALVRPENAASAGLLERRGFLREGLLRKFEKHHVDGISRDMDMYSKIRDSKD
jgi:ribosomal-protein-alanine N-acetyltransferase